MKVLHVPCFSLADPIPTLRRRFRGLDKYKSFGLIATAQHLNKINYVRSFLDSKGKKVGIGGQVLGCNQDNALKLDVECILYIGSGRFHPLGIAFKTQKPVFILNPLSGELDRITEDEKRHWMGKRKGAVSRALNSQIYGIMVSTKDGQYNLKKAQVIKDLLEDKNKRAIIFAAEELSPPNLLPFKVDCWINTACPRIEGDEYNRPVINAQDIEEIIKYI
jgi:2-(3-amino-3-carboxypropyl)histidine synthase